MLCRIAPCVPPKDVLVVKNGKLLADVLPRSPRDLKRVHDAGCSIVLRNTERFDAGIAALAARLGDTVGSRVAVQVYSTPAGFHSFGWHYDAEEVFIVQTQGEKLYYLRRNTVNPRPDIRAMPKDMRFEDEVTPVHGATLIGGDFLYIPSGWWHVARARTDSLSLSMGALPRERAAA